MTITHSDSVCAFHIRKKIEWIWEFADIYFSITRITPNAHLNFDPYL